VLQCPTGPYVPGLSRTHVIGHCWLVLSMAELRTASRAGNRQLCYAVAFRFVAFRFVSFAFRFVSHAPVRRRLTGVDWRQKIENQRGAVLATELKNNANKLARWTSAALVAGVDQIKLGYVARAHPRDRHHHVILSTQVRQGNQHGTAVAQRDCVAQGSAELGRLLLLLAHKVASREAPIHAQILSLTVSVVLYWGMHQTLQGRGSDIRSIMT